MTILPQLIYHQKLLLLLADLAALLKKIINVKQMKNAKLNQKATAPATRRSSRPRGSCQRHSQSAIDSIKNNQEILETYNYYTSFIAFNL
jgi:hypothetical protein